jgi:DNA-binding LacI/PurR family transcriptional regulator
MANLQARAVATGQSTMIGVALRDISDPYFSSIAAGLIEVTDSRRLLVCMTSTAAHEEAERESVALMRAQRARAVVLVGSRSDNTAARLALRAELDAFTRSGGRAACLAGFDDISTLRDVYPPLTTVRLPLKRLGTIAARLVLGDDAPPQPRVVPVPGEVVLRDSTLPRPPRAR